MGVVRCSVALGGKKRAHTHAFALSVHRIPAVEAAVDTCGCTPHAKPVQVWEDKYASILKSNGWGDNGGRKWPKNWREREEATAELDRILGRQVLVQLAAKTSEAGPAGESAWGVDADG